MTAPPPAAEPPAEVAPVRSGEQLDWTALEAWLTPRLGLEDGAELTVLQFPNGSANLTYLVRFGDRRLVVRRPPFGNIAPGAHDMKREFRVLSRLWQEYDRAPRAFVLCDDHDVVGSDFVVSEYRTGEVIWASVPPSMVEEPDAGRRIGLATVDA
ncbi:MAG: phosphotransferase, partial [Candidatus Rokuibacteriota bacterium]